jgi:hypothetical protein
MFEGLAWPHASHLVAALRSTSQLKPERSRSQRFHSSFTSSDTDRFLYLGNEDFPVADFSRFGLFQNRLDCPLRAIVGDHNLELNLWKKIHRVLGAAVNLAVAFLPAKSLHFAKSHSFDAGRHQRFSHRLGFEWLDNRLDFLHRAILNAAAFEMASACAECPGRRRRWPVLAKSRPYIGKKDGNNTNER